MAKGYNRFNKGILLEDTNTGPNPINPVGDATFEVDGGLYNYQAKIYAYLNSAVRELITSDQTQTLTNKTIVAADNTITTASSGNLTSTELNAALAELQGDIDTINTGLPTGDVVGTTDTQTLTNKTIDGDDNTLQDLALASLKTILADADTVLTRDATGAVVSTKSSPSGDFVGTTDAQTLTNKTVDADNNTISNLRDAEIAVDADIARSKIAPATADYVVINDAGGDLSEEQFLAKARGGTGADNTSVTFPTSGTIVTETATQTLTSKTIQSADIDGQTASNTSRITVPQDTKANLDSLTRKEGTVVYANDEDILYLDNGTDLIPVGTGSGSGGINYITNSDAEFNLTGWAEYADAAGVQPVDGTGGTATSTLARITTASDVLRGDASFQLQKPASNEQGEGVSFNFTIANTDQQSVLSIEMDYTTSSAYVDGDARVYIYDVTNSQLIEPVPTEILAGENQKLKVYFQTAPNSTSYRLIFHIASTNASAWNLTFDTVRVGPAIRAFGPVLSDWEAYTPTISGFGTPSNVSFQSRRVGNTVEIIGKFTSGTATANVAQVSMPAGLTTDGSTGLNIFGQCMRDAGAATYGRHYTLHSAGGDNNLTFGAGEDSTAISPVGNANGNQLAGAGQTLYVYAWGVPIQGWSSSQQISDDADTRVVAARATLDPGLTGITDQVIPFNSVSVDTHSAFNSSTGVFTAPVSGIYRISTNVVFGSIDSSTNPFCLIRKNASSISQHYASEFMAVATAGQVSASDIVELAKGDTLDVSADGDASFDLDGSNRCTVAIERLSGPSQIAANELVAAKYTSSSGQSIPNNSITVVEYDTLEFDTHNAHNTSTDQYVVPASGKYDVLAQATLTGLVATTTDFIFYIQKNNTDVLTVRKNLSPGPSFTLEGNTTLDLVKGDTIRVRIFQDNGGAKTLQATNSFNQLIVKRLGF